MPEIQPRNKCAALILCVWKAAGLGAVPLLLWNLPTVTDEEPDRKLWRKLWKFRGAFVRRAGLSAEGEGDASASEGGEAFLNILYVRAHARTYAHTPTRAGARAPTRLGERYAVPRPVIRRITPRDTPYLFSGYLVLLWDLRFEIDGWGWFC